MRRDYAIIAALCAACLLTSACTHSDNSNSSAQTSESPSASPTGSATPLETPSSGATAQATPVAYTDIAGVFGQKEITQLASLGVFGTPSGAFNPNGTVTRGDFVKWLVTANNAIWVNDSNKQIRPSQGTSSSFPDVPTTHPDFAFIQGMYDSGFAIGFPDKTFKPNALLTREQMIAIKESVDRGGVDKYYVNFWEAELPNWKDKEQINKQFHGAIAEDVGLDRNAVAQHLPTLAIDNVPRGFGAIAMLRPQQPATRGQAALMLWKIGAHTDKILNAQPGDAPRSAADVLSPGSPTSTP